MARAPDPYLQQPKHDSGGLCPGCGCLTQRKGDWCATCWPAYEADHWYDERKDRKATGDEADDLR